MKKSTLRLPSLKAEACSGLTLSGAFLPRLQRRGLAPSNGSTYSLTILISLFFLGAGIGLSQPASIGEKGPEIRLGEVTVKIREFESTPPLKILELQIEIFNRSRNSAVPANSIKVVVVPKEMKLSSTGTTAEFPSDPQEVILNLPIPPGAGQVVIFGFPFPKEDPDSTTFEIQINPPEGEKKMVTWEKG